MQLNTTLGLTQKGQRIWFDNLSRSLIENDNLTKLINDYNVSGVTSNPTIFYNAIKSDESYKNQLQQLKSQITDPKERYEELIIPDIIKACQLFRRIYDNSKKEDGYVSLEVSPTLANNTADTITEAKRLWDRVSQPNLMIKVPATPAGIQAIEPLIAAGINLNITLIFSLEQVTQVWQAYINGLNKRYLEQKDISHIKAVASFFISRIDNASDPKLPESLQGKTAITLAKIAYHLYLDTFNSAIFKQLQSAGAKTQDLLWASTATKNPKYCDCLYVDELIAPNTVNTLPEATLKSFKDHGNVDKAQGFINATPEIANTLEQIKEQVDLDKLAQELLQDGLISFNKSFEELIKLVS